MSQFVQGRSSDFNGKKGGVIKAYRQAGRQTQEKVTGTKQVTGWQEQNLHHAEHE